MATTTEEKVDLPRNVTCNQISSKSCENYKQCELDDGRLCKKKGFDWEGFKKWLLKWLEVMAYIGVFVLFVAVVIACLLLFYAVVKLVEAINAKLDARAAAKAAAEAA